MIRPVVGTHVAVIETSSITALRRPYEIDPERAEKPSSSLHGADMPPGPTCAETPAAPGCLENTADERDDSKTD